VWELRSVQALLQPTGISSTATSIILVAALLLAHTRVEPLGNLIRVFGVDGLQ
jgi:hypothetical protein